MSRPPHGTLTFVFTDIEGSTQRWEADASSMAAAVARHDDVLQGAVARHGGYVFKKAGDAFCAAFVRAADAVAAAVEAQREVSAQGFEAIGGLHVRMALHTGDAQERDGDYFGATLNRVARLLAIAYGDQILLSSATAALLRTELRDDVMLLDLGLQQLKDVAEPERTYQVCAPGLRCDFPTLRSEARAPNNLPLQLTGLIGREDELAAIRETLERSRLVTLSGAGGVGKTRLALQAGFDALARFPDGVWFVEFAQISDPALVASTVANAVNVREWQGQPSTVTLVKALAHKDALLIFDNCEHLVGAVANLAGALLQACPHVRILTTSRQPLCIDGEVLHRVSSLAFPTSAEGLKARDALDYSAIALFCERARAADARFLLTDDQAPVVAEICRHLDGIALAIELAAARVRVFSPTTLNRRLNERFRLLTGGNRTALPRQQTMRALIDWSYDLLDDEEQTLFRRLGSFAPDFSIAAVDDVPELLASLVEKSLVVAVQHDGAADRYYLLESTREYALDKLRERDEYAAVAARHIEYYATLAYDIDRETEPLGTEWFARLDRERENFRLALSRALVEKLDASAGAALAARLGRFWWEASYFGEGLLWIGRALEAAGEGTPPESAAALYLAYAMLTTGAQKVDAARRARDFYEAADDRGRRAEALCQLGLGLRQLRRWDEAAAALDEALTILRELQDEPGLANALISRGAIAAYCRSFDEARNLYRQALSMTRAGAFARMSSHLHLADLEFQSGDLSGAVADAVMASRLAEQNNNRRCYANARCNLAVYRLASREYVEALDDAHAALAVLRDSQNGVQIALALQHAALAGVLTGNVSEAAKLLGYVEAHFRENAYEQEPSDLWSHDRLARLLRAKVSQPELGRLIAEGAAMSEGQAIATALSIDSPARRRTRSKIAATR